MARKTYAYTEDDLKVRAIVPITQEMSDELHRIATLCKKDGKFLDRSQIVRSLILMLMKLQSQVDLKGVLTETDLVERFVRAFSKK